MKRRYVSPGPKHVPPVLPKDTWNGGLFVEADGTVLEVKFSGKHMPQTALNRQNGSGHVRTVGNPVVRVT